MSRIIAQKLFLLGLAFFLSFSLAMAQRTVKGTVTDSADGTTTPGVAVVARGTTTGTVTDMNGNFSLVVCGSLTLVLSGIFHFSNWHIWQTSNVGISLRR